MIAIKTERIAGFRVLTERDDREQLIKTVYMDYVPVVRFNTERVIERKLAAIELVERCGCSQKIAGKICGFHRNTVFKYLRIKRLLGLQAVFEDDRGLKSPFKYIGKLRSHIKQLIRRHPDWTDQAIADKAFEDLEISVSRSSVARIRTEKEDGKRADKLPSRDELIKMAKEADAIEQEYHYKNQLVLNFTWDRDLKAKSEEFSKEPAPEVEKESEKGIISRLLQGERCNFAGNLMHHLFLQEIGFRELLEPFPANKGSTYQARDIFLTLFHSIDLGIQSIEALKLVNASELGILAGLWRIPDKEVVRDHLAQMADQYLSSNLIDEFARRLLEGGSINSEVFFIDGHFLPYYGLNVIAKGYYTVRRLAMRGNEIYMVTDLQGRPLFFMTESNEIDFRPMISRCCDKLREFGISRPIMVFDRGGYGIHFFKELDKTADFITWAKYINDKYLKNIESGKFTVGFRFKDKKYIVAEEIRTASESLQTAKKERRQKPSSIELRMVILENVETGKRIGIYTNNRSKPSYKIALYMLERWGDSENLFKEMMSRFNLNYHPGYDIKELEKQPLIDNPDIELIKKAIRTLSKEIKNIENEILITEAKLVKRKNKRTEAKLSKLRRTLQEKKIDIAGFEEKMQSLPEKISILEILKDKSMSRCDLEKKKLYDLVQIMSIHSRERLLEIFRECYNDKRDIKKVLDMITGRGGYLKLAGQTIIILLDWIECKRHREAAEQLCHQLNKKGIRMAGRLNLKLFFKISGVPHHGAKAASSHMHNFT